MSKKRSKQKRKELEQKWKAIKQTVEQMNEETRKELEQIEKEIRQELSPFVVNIKTGNANLKLFNQAMGVFSGKFRRAQEIAEALLKVAVKPSEEFSEDLMELFTYMGLVESIGNTLVNIVVMVLVANGRDFHIECRYATPRIKHAISIKELEDERVPLTTKLNFLRDNGIKKLTAIIDSELRNEIAHLRFDFRKNRVVIKGKPASEIASAGTVRLIYGCMITLISIAEAVGITLVR